MKNLLSIIAAAWVAGGSAWAGIYSTEATMARLKDKDTCEFQVSVSQMMKKGGGLTEEVISRPRIKTAPGVSASLYSGLQPSQRDYKKTDNVSVDVSWPAAGKTDFAICTVVVKRGDEIVSKTKMQVMVDEK